jgi:hypothetical protein
MITISKFALKTKTVFGVRQNQWLLALAHLFGAHGGSSHWKYFLAYSWLT